MARLSKTQREVLTDLASGMELGVQRYGLEERYYLRKENGGGGRKVNIRTAHALHDAGLLENLRGKPYGHAAYTISDAGKAALEAN